MDWDLKMPPWDLAELEEGSSVVVGLGGGGCSSAGGLLDCSVDLKLGGLGEFGPAGSWTTSQQRKVLTAMVSTSSGPSRRARAMGHGGQIPSCLVDGCISDLSKCREYHRRHKVCEVHSKTAIVLVGGREQRFCQQCSRFHLLVEFDEVKRSCRKRLDGHNRRRRKPQPDLNSGSFITSHQGARFSSYSQIFPNPTSEPSWAARLVKMEQDLLSSHHRLPLHRTDRHQNHISFSRGGYREGRQISFLPETVEASVCQPLLKSLSTPSESGGLARALDSDCALSLLSSPSHQISGISNLSQMVGARMAPIADRIPVGQPLVPGFGLSHYSSSQVASSVSPTGLSCSGTDEHVGTVLVAAASDANLHCYGLFRAGGEGPSDGSCPPFSW